MLLHKWGERKRPRHHHFGSRKRRIAGVHVAKMNFAFVRDRRPAQQRVVLIDDRNFDAATGQLKRHAAAL
jgi:hypothetical protein